MQHNIEPTEQAIHYLRHPEDRSKTYHVFIYGTLKQGCYNHMYMKGCSYVRKHAVAGYKIRTAGSVPFLEPTGDYNDVALGEIFSITEKLKKTLDKLEEGYKFTEIEKGIYSYVPDFNVSKFEEIPINHSGYYEWTPALELKYEVDPTQRKLKARYQYEQAI